MDAVRVEIKARGLAMDRVEGSMLGPRAVAGVREASHLQGFGSTWCMV